MAFPPIAPCDNHNIATLQALDNPRLACGAGVAHGAGVARCSRLTCEALGPCMAEAV